MMPIEARLVPAPDRQMASRNVLVFHLGALGDFVLTWPLAMALARMHPQSRIIYVSHRQKGLLAEKALGVESTDIEAGWHHLFGDAAALPRREAKLLAGSHAIYTFISNPSDQWTSAVRRLAPYAELVHLRARPPAGYEEHATAYVIEQLSDHPAVCEGVRQMTRWIEANGVRRAKPASPNATVVIHPGSGGEDKCWAIERYMELARRLMDGGREVRFVIGEAELERWPGRQVVELEQVAPVDRPSSYIELLSVLQAASLFIGNDSGPSHLAGILGTPTVAIFGPSEPRVWRPIGPRVKTVSAERTEGIGVDEVLRVSTEELGAP